MTEKISIIIPCFNDVEYIERSVQSAIDQTIANKEIIIIDDGSDLKTKALLKKLEPKITLLITQKNKGPSAARNMGIRESRGKFILVLDSDDYFEPNFCEKALEVFYKKENVKMVTCHARWFRSENDFQIFQPEGGDIKNFLLKNSSLATMFLKKDWEACGGYDENMIKGFEDWEFYIRLHEGGGSTYVIPEVLFHYRKKEGSRNVVANKYKYELLEYIYLKHTSLYKDNFELFMKYILDNLKSKEMEQIKRAEQIDFKLGKYILAPLRKIKSILRSSK